tara:strand:- start:4306 stop:7536 length:3231 start_codon:yes stop_codon:yes gene_type:complete
MKPEDGYYDWNTKLTNSPTNTVENLPDSYIHPDSILPDYYGLPSNYGNWYGSSGGGAGIPGEDDFKHKSTEREATVSGGFTGLHNFDQSAWNDWWGSAPNIEGNTALGDTSWLRGINSLWGGYGSGDGNVPIFSNPVSLASPSGAGRMPWEMDFGTWSGGGGGGVGPYTGQQGGDGSGGYTWQGQPWGTSAGTPPATPSPIDFNQILSDFFTNNPNIFSPNITVSGQTDAPPPTVASPNVTVQGGLTQPELNYALSQAFSPYAGMPGNINTIGTDVGNLSRDISGLGSQMATGFDTVDTNLGTVGRDVTGLASQLATGLNTMSDSFGGLVGGQSNLADALAANKQGIWDVQSGVNRNLMTMADILSGQQGISDQFGGVSNAISGVGNRVADLWGGQGGQGGGLNDMWGGIGDIQSNLGGVQSGVSSLADKIAANEGVAAAWRGGMGKGMADALTNQQAIQSLISGLGGNVSGIREDLFGAPGTDNIGAFANLGNQMTSGFGGMGNRFSGLEDLLFGVRGTDDIGAFANMGNQISSGFGGLESGIGNRFSNLQELLFGVPGSPNIGAFSTMGNQMSGLGSQMSDIGSGLNARLAGLREDLYGVPGTDNIGSFNVLGNQMGGLGNQMSALGTNFADRFGGLEGLLFGDQFGDIGALGRLGTDLSTLGTDIGSGFSGLGSELSDFEDRLGTRFGNVFRGQSGLSDQMSGLGTDYAAGLESLLSGQRGFGDTLSSGMTGLEDRFGAGMDQFDTRLGQLVDPLTAGQAGLNSTNLAILQQIEGIKDLIPTLGDIEGLIPNQQDMTDLYESGTLDKILADINSAFKGTDLKARDWTTDQVDWSGSPDRVDDNLVDYQGVDAPVLDMPEIMDYTGAMRVPLIENVLSRVGGANPYDTRQNAILEGQESAIDKNYDDAIERVKNQFAVTDDLGSPAYRAAIREVEEGRARDKTAVQSQFQMQAAGLDESMARGRLQDLSSALLGEQGRVMQEMGMQDSLQRQANQDYLNYINALQSSYYQPQQWRDEGLRYALGGLGNAVQPNMAAATTGLGAASQSSGDIANALFSQGGTMFNNLINQIGQKS